MTEVFINDVLIDLEEEETVTATYTGVTFGKMSTRKGIKTNTYNLPYSQVNKGVYEGAEVQGSYSDKPYRKGTIRVDIDGVTVFEGWCVLEESGEDGYEVQSFAGASDFYTIINNKKLGELDLSAYDHIWNEPNIKNSWSRTDGYIYAFVEYGKAFSFNIIPPDYLMPQFFFHTIVKQIATDAGYMLFGDVLTNPRFLKHVIIPNKWPIAIQYGGDWDLSTLLPDLTQSKVWLDFANIYGLQFDINELTGEIYANYIDDALFSEPEDWTLKIDRSEKRKTRYRFDEWGQTSYLRYNYESIEVQNSAWQDFQKAIAIDDHNLKLEADIYKSEFFMIQDLDSVLNPDGSAITRTFVTKSGKGFAGIWQDDFNYVGGIVFYNGTYYQAIEPPGINRVPSAEPDYWEPIEEGDIWDIKSRPMYGILTTDVTFTLQVDFPTPVTITRVINNTGMSWEDTYPLHYRVFNRIIDRTKRVEDLVKLNYADVNQLKFNRSKRIDNELYILEEVLQFKLNKKESTTCKLVRI
jgi:hypothetical protein